MSYPTPNPEGPSVPRGGANPQPPQGYPVPPRSSSNPPPRPGGYSAGPQQQYQGAQFQPRPQSNNGRGMVKAGKVFLIIGVIALIATIVSGFGLTKSVKDMTKFLSEGVPISGSGTVSMTQGDERAIWGSNSASGQCSVKGPSGATVPIVPIDAHFQNQEIDWKALGTFKASSTGDHTVTCPGSSTYLVTDQFDIGKIGGMVGWTLGLTLGGVIAFIGLVLGLILFLVGRNKR